MLDAPKLRITIRRSLQALTSATKVSHRFKAQLEPRGRHVLLNRHQFDEQHDADGVALAAAGAASDLPHLLLQDLLVQRSEQQVLADHRHRRSYPDSRASRTVTQPPLPRKFTAVADSITSSPATKLTSA